MKNNIVLTGMPASGKSSVGVELQKLIPEYTFIDTDSMIQKTYGMTISEIFEKHGEDYFRKLENETIKIVCNGEKRIISIGGGCFENPDNRARLLQFGIVFYLKTDVDTLYYRLSEDNTRPLLNNPNPKETLLKLLKNREDNYNKANYTIDVNTLTVQDAAKKILEIVNETTAKSKH
jgi:shikimate kinase